jgi:hypothetical protein
MNPGRVGKTLAALADRTAPPFAFWPIDIPSLCAALALLRNAVEHSPDICSLEYAQLHLPSCGTKYSRTATSYPT